MSSSRAARPGYHFENTWAAPFVAALRRGGAEHVASGRIPITDLQASLDGSSAS